MTDKPIVYVERFGLIGTETKIIEADDYEIGGFNGWVTVWKEGEKAASFRTETVKAVWKDCKTSLNEEAAE